MVFTLWVRLSLVLPFFLILLACGATQAVIPTTMNRLPAEFPLYPESIYVGGYFKGSHVEATYEVSDPPLRVMRFYQASLTYGPWRQDKDHMTETLIPFHADSFLDHRHGSIELVTSPDGLHSRYKIVFIYS